MKYRLLQAIAMSLIIMNGTELYAQVYQVPPVVVSKDKVRSSNGTLCYSHFVPEKQTLYSISKAYGVTLEEIYAVNPGLKQNGIKKNSIILIPVKDKLPDPEEITEQTTLESAESGQVEEKQQISKKIQEVEKNPAEKGNDVTAAPQKNKQQKDYIIHRVKWFENIDDIALKYQIPADYILQFNGLKGKKVKARMKLKIPTEYQPEDFLATKEIISEENEEVNSQNEEYEENDGKERDWFNSKKDISILLNLPFNAEGNPNKNSMDLYSGFLLGIKDLDNTVTNIDLSVYDCAKKLPLTPGRVSQSQMIFGPISSSQLEELAMLQTGSNMLISPLDPRAEKLAGNFTNFIQAPPCSDAQIQDLTKWVSADLKPEDNVITIYEKNNSSKHITNFNDIIMQSDLNSKFFSYTILEGRNLNSRLDNELTKNGTNRIIINSENEAFVNDVIRNLNILLHKKNQIVIYCTSKVKSFETIDVENLHNLNAHMTASYHIDYEEPETKKFVLAYRALYGSEPSQYAFQGYDLATYFIGLYTRYGAKWHKHLKSHPVQLRQVTFDFRKTENGSYLNYGTRRFIYEDNYKIRMIK